MFGGSNTLINRLAFDEAAFAARTRPTPIGTLAMAPPVAPLAAGPISPTLQQEIAYISGVNADGTIASTSYWSSYEHVTAFKFGSPTAGTGATITYAFDPASAFTATEQTTFREALVMWQSVADIHFVTTTSPLQADILLHRGNDGSAYTTSEVSRGSGTTLGQYTGQAAISIDTGTPGFDLSGSFYTVGGYGVATVIHEIGHALGLGHAGGYNETVDPATQQFSVYDDALYSTMSYLSWENAGTAKFRGSYPVTKTDWGYSDDGYSRTAPHTVQQLDILAIQRLYGVAQYPPLSGGQVYGFNTNIVGPLHDFFDFDTNRSPIVTLYNQGTNNTLDLSGYYVNQTIDLNPGTFSSVGGLVNNLGIAFGTQIDTVRGGSGADTIIGNDNGDTLLGGNGPDRINGGNGSDLLDGGAGGDTLVGGAGDDTYVVDDNFFDKVVETAGGGYDLVKTTALAYMLGADVEALFYAGTSAAHLTGNSSNNSLTGGNGDDWLDGGSGADTLTGGAGDDTYIIDSASDHAIEAVGGGDDSIETALTRYILGAGIEALTYTGSAALTCTGNYLDNTLTGGAAADVLSGLAGNDVLDGGEGNDRLDGGIGIDTLIGGAGDDTYVIDDAGDVVVETGGGYDLVRTTLAEYTLDGVIEALVFAGSANAVDTGNALDNRLTGGAGNDVLNGLAGADTLVGGGGNDRLDGGTGADTLGGGAGDDIYVIDDIGDKAIETSLNGFDLVVTALGGYTLGTEIEALTFTGAAGATGVGNRLANVLTGGNGNDALSGLSGDDTLIGGNGGDRLDGGEGADAMAGGTGDDRYYIDDVGDVVTEDRGRGNDTVFAEIDYTLGNNVENLTLSGRARAGTGNGMANVITGGQNADALSGLNGNDVLVGGTERDRLTGGGGADIFVFADGDSGNSVKSADTIADFSHARHDKIDLSAIDADGGTSANDKFVFIGDAAFGGHAGELRYGSLGADTLLMGDTDGDGTADLVIRLSGHVALVTADFTV